MHLLDTPQPPLAPGTCIICGLSPKGDWVDTLFDGDFGQAHEFNGRKYVCGSCGEQIAGVLGLTRADERLEAAEHEVLVAQVKYDRLLERLHGALLEEDA